MHINVKYENHAGEIFILQGDDLSFLDVLPLFSFSWDYELVNSVSGLGGIATGFARFPRTIDLDLRMRGYSRAQFLAQMNRLHAITEVDALNQTPGRLYVEDQYISCFLAVSGDVKTAPMNGNFAMHTVTCLIVRPVWCTDQNFVFNPPSQDPAPVDDMGKKYNLRYPYRYSSSLITRGIINDHYADAPAIITIYGPAGNPQITIGGNVYGVNTVVSASERLVIDQINHTIEVVGSEGQKKSVFNLRNKTADIFAPVPPGQSVVTQSDSFLFSVTLVEQRSQLKWTV